MQAQLLYLYAAQCPQLLMPPNPFNSIPFIVLFLLQQLYVHLPLSSLQIVITLFKLSDVFRELLLVRPDLRQFVGHLGHLAVICALLLLQLLL